MEQLKMTMLIHPGDNVSMAIEPIAAGETAKVGDERIVALDAIPVGHKIACRDIAAGEMIIKYNVVIGKASAPIRRGEWVHSHNVEDITEQLQAEAKEAFMENAKKGTPIDAGPVCEKAKLSRESIMAYPRPDGRFGIRNHVLVVSIIQCANSAAQKIAAATGAPCITQEGGCLEFPDRLHRLILGFTAAGTHPNVFGVLVVSLGCQQIDPQKVVGPIEQAGKKVHHLCIQKDGGYHKVVAEGIRLVKEMQAEAMLQNRIPCPVSGLVLAGYNGGSDWTSGLVGNVVAGKVIDMHEAGGGTALCIVGRGDRQERAATYEVAYELMDIGEKFREDNRIRGGKGLSQVNPTPGNKAGGLTTLEEKNLGSFKTDGHCKLRGVLKCGELPPGPGAWGVNQVHGNNDCYACTSLAMSGAHIIIFPTGKGTPVGDAVSCILKTTGNRDTYAMLPEAIDYCSAPVMWGEKTMDEASLEMYELILDIAEGKLTRAEELGDYSYTIPHGTSLNGDYPLQPPTCPAE